MFSARGWARRGAHSITHTPRRELPPPRYARTAERATSRGFKVATVFAGALALTIAVGLALYLTLLPANSSAVAFCSQAREAISIAKVVPTSVAPGSLDELANAYGAAAAQLGEVATHARNAASVAQVDSLRGGLSNLGQQASTSAAILTSASRALRTQASGTAPYPVSRPATNTLADWRSAAMTALSPVANAVELRCQISPLGR